MKEMMCLLKSLGRKHRFLVLPLVMMMPLLTGCPQEKEPLVEVEYYVNCEGCKVAYTDEDGEETQTTTTANWSKKVELENGSSWNFEGEIEVGEEDTDQPFEYRVTVFGGKETTGNSMVSATRNFFSISGAAE